MPSAEKPVGKSIELERGLVIDAAIIRIMKARRVSSHSDLYSEVLVQSAHFKPDGRFVKQRISILIEKCFLERDEANPTIYKYLP